MDSTLDNPTLMRRSAEGATALYFPADDTQDRRATWVLVQAGANIHFVGLDDEYVADWTETALR